MHMIRLDGETRHLHFPYIADLSNQLLQFPGNRTHWNLTAALCMPGQKNFFLFSFNPAAAFIPSPEGGGSSRGGFITLPLDKMLGATGRSHADGQK